MDGIRTQTDRSVSFCPSEPVWKRALSNSAKRVKGLLNRKPRKPLKYATPTEAFLGQLFGVAIIEWVWHLIVEFAGLNIGDW